MGEIKCREEELSLLFFLFTLLFIILQFSSVAQSCPTLCDPMNRRTPGLPVHHQLLEFTQTHVHQVGDAIQPSHPLSSPSPPAPNPSQHQGLLSLAAAAKSLQLCPTPCHAWTVAHQVLLPVGSSRQEYWSGLPCSLPGDLLDLGTESMSPTSPALGDGFFSSSTT